MNYNETVKHLEDRLASVKTAGRWITALVAILALFAGAFIGKQAAETDGWDAGYQSGYVSGFDMTCPGKDWR
ncbi:Uncharacterised protein [Corynebacterium imitans]|uniref:Uncharacterized protein n=1 Tax=Corynebacterium imitans TaxID=156978 RepID=A0A076NR86_9CORY|nr:hypothetical protein [Corynebacterium imitans]AIJ33442.1 hypothetical protein CIMIT_05585 [Corynebacterium imitans]SNV70388.1 Uncharacterised protein [Corynebacterium imitans]